MARSVFVDENEVVPFRGDVTDFRLLQAMHGDAVKARPGQVFRYSGILLHYSL